ncbi:MAG TPA: type II toxin-antitoxin system RelE/ParE family toxin [Longimicrobium sp.]|nr:type II toxin-antitoxin system RelE/ParE family toxin [Longimicrobium sp.]
MRVHPLATRETHKTADWYDKDSPTRGDRFVDQVEYALRRIRENPNIGELNDRGERKLLLRKFPYKVVYRTEGERIFVVAVAHQKRRDGYWRRRQASW